MPEPTAEAAKQRQRDEMLRMLDAAIPPTETDHDTTVIVRSLLAQGWTPEMVAARTGAPLKIVRRVQTTIR